MKSPDGLDGVRLNQSGQTARTGQTETQGRAGSYGTARGQAGSGGVRKYQIPAGNGVSRLTTLSTAGFSNRDRRSRPGQTAQPRRLFVLVLCDSTNDILNTPAV